MKITKMFPLVAFFITLTVFAPTAHAWYNDTHAIMMSKVCKAFNCPLTYNDIFKWSNYPDTDLKDNQLHLCIWKECPAQIMYTSRLRKAGLTNDGNDKWKEIAIASHYYFDAKNVFHQVPQNGYNVLSCHREFESQTNEFVRKKQTNWTVEVCEVNVNDAQLAEFVLDFEEH